jgi:PAS domain-containing protein
MLDVPGNGLVGSSLSGLVAAVAGAGPHAILLAMARGVAHAEDVQLRLLGGQTLWVRLEASPVPGHAGLAILLLRDISMRKASDARLVLALEAGALGTWELNLRTGVFERSAMHDHIFGYTTPHLEWSFTRLLQHVLGADRKMVENSLREALTARSAWQFRCRIRRGQDRALRWIEVRGAPEGVGPDGVALRLVGVVADVTERAAIESSLRRAKRTLEQQVAERAARLAESEVRLRTVFEHTAEALFLVAVAPDGGFVFQGHKPGARARDRSPL